MTIEYCTIMNGAYVSRLLALHRSMTRHGAEPRWRVCCTDAHAVDLIDRLGLPAVSTLPLRQLEASDPDLSALRSERQFREYRSTAKPCLCRYLFELDPSVDVMIYLDVDLMFFADPAALVEELGEGSVLIVPQRHAPEERWLDEVFGLYQAGSIAFRRGPEARAVLDWWRARCLEWCSFDPEPGRWADQRYLQDWPERFDGVRVARNPGINLAPWSEARHGLFRQGTRLFVENGPLVFYHYSGAVLSTGPRPFLRLLGLLPGNRFSPGRVPLAWGQLHHPAHAAESQLVWEPYVSEVSAALAAVREIEPAFRGDVVSAWKQLVEVVLRKRVLWKVMWELRGALGRAGALRLVGLVDRLRARWDVT